MIPKKNQIDTSEYALGCPSKDPTSPALSRGSKINVSMITFDFDELHSSSATSEQTYMVSSCQDSWYLSGFVNLRIVRVK
jgi:hypothetical protein